MKSKLELAPYKVFNFSSGYYIFTSNGNKLYEIENDLYSILLDGEKKYSIRLDSERADYLDLVEKLSKHNSISVYEDYDIRSVVLMIAQDCNLKCKYCYGSGGEYNNCGKMPFDVAKNAIDFLISNCGERKQLGVTFFGGEPLLNFSLIQNIIKYTDSIESSKGLRFSKSITTNGTLLTKKIKEFLLDNKIDIKISIDGPEQTHDYMRIYENGSGSFNDILKNTEDIRKTHKLSARATITPNNLNTMEIEKYLYDIGFSDVGMACAEEMFSEHDYNKLLSIEIGLFDGLKQLINTGKYNEIKKGYSKQYAYLSHLHRSVSATYPCGAGRTFIAIDKDGNIFPCQRFVGNEDFILGNVLTDNLEQTNYLEETKVSSHKECQSCWCINICLGKCSYNNYIKTGSTNHPYPNTCSITRQLYAKAIEVYCSLTPEQKKYLFNNGKNHQ